MKALYFLAANLIQRDDTEKWTKKSCQVIKRNRKRLDVIQNNNATEEQGLALTSEEEKANPSDSTLEHEFFRLRRQECRK